MQSSLAIEPFVIATIEHLSCEGPPRRGCIGSERWGTMSDRAGGRRRAGVVLAVMAGLLTILILVPRVVPDGSGLALPLEAVLPWLGVPVALVCTAALARRAWLARLVGIAAVIAWGVVFVPRILPLAVPVSNTAASSAAPLTVLSQNLHGADGGPEKTARAALDRAPDLIAFQELDAASRESVAAVFAGEYPYTATVGTVGLWSRYPLEGIEPLDLGLGWNRAMHVTMMHPSGPIGVYAVHAASARIASHEQRDAMLSELTALAAGDPAERLLVVGDFNAGTDDRSLAGLSGSLEEPRQSSGGFGFTWPRQFPFVRLDHVFHALG
ncbi:hypothetical protein FQR65_LT20110 [Abscondita terminalis]|nr:hypothetical protein FQR65_LT20110 [Abscondita terminalis]